MLQGYYKSDRKYGIIKKLFAHYAAANLSSEKYPIKSACYGKGNVENKKILLRNYCIFGKLRSNDMPLRQAYKQV